MVRLASFRPFDGYTASPVPLVHCITLLPQQAMPLLFLGPRSASDAVFLSIPCPRTCRLKRVVLSGGALFELLHVKPSTPASFFVDEQVVAAGGVIIASSYDVLFHLLPLVSSEGTDWAGLLSRAARDDAHRKQGLLKGSSQLVHVLRSLQPAAVRALQGICDESTPTNVYRLDKAKALALLQRKVERLAAALHAKSIVSAASMRQNAFSTSSTAAASPEDASASTSVATPTPEHHLAAAFACVSEYLSDAWAADLEAACGCVLEVLFMATLEPRGIVPPHHHHWRVCAHMQILWRCQREACSSAS
jgi:hypothetical protein